MKIKNYAFGTPFYYFFLIHISILGAAQQTNSDSTTYEKAILTSLVKYRDDVKENLNLFNGAQYLFETNQSFGFPFCDADSSIIGSLCYDGNYYTSIPLKYDLVNQKVIISAFNKTAEIILNNQKVKRFRINNHDFFWIDEETYKNVFNGFYDRLYLGKIAIWAKRRKELKLSLNAEDQTGKFKEFDQYYLQTGNVFNLITTKNQIIKVLKDNRERIEMYVKVNKLNFKDDFEADVIKVANYYDQLKH